MLKIVVLVAQGFRIRLRGISFISCVQIRYIPVFIG